jgi:hypothetical protein
MPPPLWTTIQQNLRGAGTWDSVAFEATQRQPPAPVFVIPDDLRRQVLFWKDRRNDCAHSKDNKITASHVETLHAFIESNMNKFAVNGSRTEMARRIREHYDPSQTPPGTDITPLVADIAHAILQEEFPDFLAELSASFDAARDPIEVLLSAVSPQKLDFLNGILQAGSPPLVQACSVFLLAGESLLLSFLRTHPERIMILDSHPEKVRRLWHEFLFVDATNDFPVVAGLLRNGLVPAEQIDECLRHLIHKGTAAVPNDVDNVAMEGNGFYAILEDILVNTRLLSQFNWANRCKPVVVKHIAEHPLSVELARAIYQNYDAGYHPWHMASHLNDFFAANEEKRNEYIAISDTHVDIGRPGHIPSLTAVT